MIFICGGVTALDSELSNLSFWSIIVDCKFKASQVLEGGHQGQPPTSPTSLQCNICFQPRFVKSLTSAWFCTEAEYRQLLWLRRPSYAGAPASVKPRLYLYKDRSNRPPRLQTMLGNGGKNSFICLYFALMSPPVSGSKCAVDLLRDYMYKLTEKLLVSEKLNI